MISNGRPNNWLYAERPPRSTNARHTLTFSLCISQPGFYRYSSPSISVFLSIRLAHSLSLYMCVYSYSIQSFHLTTTLSVSRYLNHISCLKPLHSPPTCSPSSHTGPPLYLYLFLPAYHPSMQRLIIDRCRLSPRASPPPSLPLPLRFKVSRVQL